METDRQRSFSRNSTFIAIACSVAIVLVSIGVITAARSGSPAPTRESPALVAHEGVWIGADELGALTTVGPAWDAVAEAALEDWGDPDISDQNSTHDVHTLAGALYARRLDDPVVAERVIDALGDVQGTYSDEILALSRNLLSYVVAADVIGYRTESFERWLETSLTRPGHSRAGIRTLLESALRDPSNHGAHARASSIAAARYLGDDDLVGEIAGRFHDWLGRSSDDFEWRELDWQADTGELRGINAPGSRLNGANVDGVLPEEQRRSGGFADPAPREPYAWEGMQGTIATAELLWRAGYDTWNWEDQALRRAMDWLYDVNRFPPEGDDRWIPWIVNAHVSRDYPVTSPTEPGKNMGFTDWTHDR